MARLAFMSFSLFLLLLLIVDGYYFVILYTISSGGGGYVMIFNKSKLKIIMSCQSAHCKGATNCFLFSLYSLKTYCHQALKTTPTYWIISQHFLFSLSRLLCYFSFDFICAFVALNFFRSKKQSSVKGAQARDSVKHDSPTTCFLFFERFFALSPESMF